MCVCVQREEGYVSPIEGIEKANRFRMVSGVRSGLLTSKDLLLIQKAMENNGSILSRSVCLCECAHV